MMKFALPQFAAFMVALAVASVDRPLYAEEDRPDFPVFNSLPGEENFLSITDPNGTVYDDTIELQIGQQYDVAIKYHNNALPRGVRTDGIANDTTVKVDFPFTLSGEQKLVATISARDSQPQSVSCALTLRASEPMALEVIPQSARIVNNNPTNGSIISPDELMGEGALIGTNSMIGIVLYGPENAGSVIFSFRTVSPEQIKIQPPTKPAPPEVIGPPSDQPPASRSDWNLMGVIGVVLAILAVIGVIIYLLHLCRKMGEKN